MNRILLDEFHFSVADSDYERTLTAFRDGLPDSHGQFVVFFEGNLLSCCLRDEKVRNCLGEADFIFPDGVAVAKLASWECGHPVERISGPTFLLKACDYGQKHHWKHYFYGGTPESLTTLTAKLKKAYPEMIIAGSYSPPFRPLTPEEDAKLLREINGCKPDFLWVGLGGPKQEFWIQSHRDRLQVPFLLGVGAAFDFHSGARPWAPAVIRKMGLEWLWRALSGGRKTFFRNLRCVSAVSWYLLKTRLTRGRRRTEKTSGK